MQEKINKMGDFSHNFSALLKQKCLSQADVAVKTGIHKQSINRYATGKTLPGWSELIRLADALNCTLDSFRTGIYEAQPDNVEIDHERELFQQLVGEVGNMEEALCKLKELCTKLF